MTLWKLVKRSLGFYWRTNLGVLLATMVGAAIFVGALAVGDCVRYSLKLMVNARLGKTQFALVLNDRFIRAQLANELAAELNAAAAPLLQLRGLITNSDSTRRANKIVVLGVDERFYKLAAGANPLATSPNEAVILNGPLAAKLGVNIGDEVVLRMEKPGLVPRDVPLSPGSDLSIAARLKVKAIAGDAQFGRFSLQANQASQLNAFVPIQWLQEKVGRSGQANILLAGCEGENPVTVEKTNQAIKKCWRLGDAGLELRRLSRQEGFQIQSGRVFLDESIADAAMKINNKAAGVLTYFVNELRIGDRAAPYSMVAALGPSADAGKLVPSDMQDDEIVINQWLADDLSAKVGDSLEITYFVLKPAREIAEQKSSFRVRAILPVDGPALDPQLMPDFPGIADVNNCRDWKPGIPIELGRIRARDEEYWQRYRGTPKAFVTLKAGRAMWRNRYGSLTAVRYPSDVSEKDITEGLLNSLDPASLGLFFQSVRQRGTKAGSEATDFGRLFLGFSAFLIIAALILTALIFVFGVESRSRQVGMFLAVGFTTKLVRRLLFIEGAVLAVLGAVIGAAAGLLYTRAMIYGLATGWRVAVGGAQIHFYARPLTLLIGASGAVAVCLAAIWLTLRRQVLRPASELLGAVPQWQFRSVRPALKNKKGLWVAAVAAGGAVLLLATMDRGNSGAVSIAFFGAGALLLVAGLAISQASLKIAGGSWHKPAVSLVGLGLRNSTRRSGRSLAVVAMLACGIFLVVAVGANRHDPSAQLRRRDSGTGGFALFGESAIGILYDLNTAPGRQAMGLTGGALKDISAVQLRVRDGDDASCFNLNRAQMPRLLGVRPQQLQSRGAFGFIETIEGPEQTAWELLNCNYGADVVPAVGDYATIVWALGKSVGDELEYIDEQGQKFRLQLVGMLKNSILQGSLLISEDQFVKRFPSESGYRMFLIDAPEDKANAAAENLSAALRDFGLELVPAGQRLAEFAAVENTYLSVFSILGGLGLVLGSAGLGLVVLRNILERRGELAMFQAVGFCKRTIRRMIFYEHWVLVAGGLACGIIAALVAVGPAIKSPRAEVPYVSLALTIIAIAASGAVWILLAIAFALGGNMLESLRNE